MSLIPEVALPHSFPAYETFRDHFGFVPAIFRAQSLLPRVIEAEAQLVAAVLLAPGALTRVQKETTLLRLDYEHRNLYGVAFHRHVLGGLGVTEPQLHRLAPDAQDARLSEPDAAMIDFARRLSVKPASVHGGHIEALRTKGLSDGHILEAILTAALANFLCTLSAGLDIEPDVESPAGLSSTGLNAVAARQPQDAIGLPQTEAAPPMATKRPYLDVVDRDPEEFWPFAFFLEQFGFVPNLFRAQTLRPDVLEAEAVTLRTVLLTGDVLSRLQKEFILLVISAENLNTYCVAVHSEMLRNLGVPEDASDQIAVDHRHADLSTGDKALLDAALKIARRSPRFDSTDVHGLRRHGFADSQVLEAVVMASLTNFLNTLQVGLGTVPDVHPRRVFETGMNLSEPRPHPIRDEGLSVEPSDDPDATLSSSATRGDREAFELLVRRHHQRLYRMLLFLTRIPEDAEDATQWAFLKAFQHLRDFKGQARFGTWLTRIAINEGLECVRRRRPMESLSSGDADSKPFQPRLVLAWADDPEQLYQREELRALVERAVMSLPMRYRMAVLLRDLEQLSTAEAAAVLGLETPTLKTHLLRGRLMLREALAPHFVRPSGGAGV